MRSGIVHDCNCKTLSFVRPPYQSSIHRLLAISDFKVSAIQLEDILKRDDLLLEAQESSPMLITRAYNVNSLGVWHQSARAEFVTYEDV